MRIFYSWQSDSPGNRRYLQDCLEQATAEMSGVVIDTATRDAEGAIDIAASILAKINEADLILADVSIIGEITEGKKMPNPNVLYELGYALGKKGDGALILAANKESTNTADLPFDIRNRLILLKDFTAANKNRMASELKTIIENHNQPPTIPETLEHPYIYLQLRATSMTDNTITFSTINGESDEYILESIEIGEIETNLRQTVPAGESPHTFSVSGLPVVPFYIPYSEMTFVVSRMSKSYMIKQAINTSGRADGRYNLDSFDPSPSEIIEIPKPRNCEVVELDRTGDSFKVLITDSTNQGSFTVGVSGTQLRVWDIPSGYEHMAVKRLAKVVNNQLRGCGSGTYMFTSYNSGQTLNNTIEMIYSNNLELEPIDE